MTDVSTRLLIVDDTPDNLFILEQIAQSHLPECKLLLARTAEEGLALAATAAPDGALIDVQMPGIDGIELCRRLKANPATRQIPVILLTAHRSSPELRARGLEVGADDFISRPIDNVELVARIQVMLRVRRAEMALQWELAVNQTLAELSKVLLEQPGEIGPIAEMVLDHARTLTASPEGYVAEVVDAASAPVCHAWTSGFDAACHRGEVDVPRAQPHQPSTRTKPPAGGAQPVLKVPVQFDGCLAGQICLGGAEGGYGPRERDAAERLAEHFALALRRHREGEQLARLQEQVQQMQRLEAIGTLAGGIAHDFNNILAAVIGFTELAREDLEPQSTGHESLNEVLKAAHRARCLIQQILTFSRRQEQQHPPVSLHPVIEEALALLQVGCPSEVTIVTALDPQAGAVAIDPTRVHQVMMNLGTNALHALSEAGGELRVRLEPLRVDATLAATLPELRPGDYVRLSVQDSGPGMDRTTRERIFEPYFSTKPTGKGSGLGLAVVHGIVASHGGAVRVDTAPGKGAAFSIYLPRFTPAAEATEAVVTEQPHVSDHVLLVDDDPTLVQLGQRMLQSLGYQVTATTSSQEALTAFRAAPQGYDLVLTDQVMPELNGIELAQELLRLRPELPIVLCSGFGGTATSEQARTLGLREYLGKPFSKEELAQALSRALAPAER